MLHFIGRHTLEIYASSLPIPNSFKINSRSRPLTRDRSGDVTTCDVRLYRERLSTASRRESGVATMVTRRLACAASLQNAEPLLVRAQFIEPFER